MNVNPLDLQVLFSKALDIQGTIQKASTLNENVEHALNTQTAQSSKDAPEVVRNTEEYAEEFTKINEEGHQREEQASSGKRNPDTGEQGENGGEEPHGGLIDELSGHHVDIFD